MGNYAPDSIAVDFSCSLMYHDLNVSSVPYFSKILDCNDRS